MEKPDYALAAIQQIVSALVFFNSAVIICLGVLSIVGTIVIINNLFSKYWSPVKMISYTPPVQTDSTNPEERGTRLL